ncbi:MAG: N-formylglutamate deformylase [Thermoleophilia bacterium]
MSTGRARGDPDRDDRTGHRRLPLLISVPHAGLKVPEEVARYVILTPEQIARDGDGQAAAIFSGLEERVAAFHISKVARVVVDLNRAPNDRRPDGVVKTHTCWGEPVYDPSPPEEVLARLIALYHTPYHRALSEAAGRAGLRLGVDCHTMAAEGPPIGPDPGRPRPLVCLSNADGTCPDAWMAALSRAFMEWAGDSVSLNDPFRGGHIIRSHAPELPWVQIEISRTNRFSPEEKRRAVELALERFCRETLV